MQRRCLGPIRVRKPWLQHFNVRRMHQNLVNVGTQFEEMLQLQLASQVVINKQTPKKPSRGVPIHLQ